MNLKLAMGAIVASVCLAAPAMATTIVNGDFEADGVTTFPSGWTTNGAPWLIGSHQGVVGTAADVEHGSFALQISNDTGQALPTLSQTLSTTVGVQYTITFWAMAPNSDSNSFLDVFVDGVGDTITGTLPYTEETFSFLGTGSDTLSISALNTPSFYYVDNFNISSSVTATPLPAALPLFAGGLGMIGWIGSKKRRKIQTA